MYIVYENYSLKSIKIVQPNVTAYEIYDMGVCDDFQYKRFLSLDLKW